MVLIALGAAVGASAQSFSNETAWDDGTNFYYKASYTGSYAHFNVLLDTDNNASTGYSINSIGADYMIQDTYAYKSTVNGGWGWSQVSTSVTETYPSGGTVQFEVPLSVIGSPSSAKIAFQGGDANWNMTTDPNVITYTKSTGTTFSNETAWNDSTNFYYQASYTGSWSHFEVFLDTDNNASTGYTINTIGADYLLEDTSAYQSTANGNSWSWSSSIGTVTETIGSGTIKMAVPLSVIGSATSAKVAFQVLTSSWTPTVDPHVVTFTKTGSAPAAPTGLSASAGNSQVSLTWSSSSGATSYNVYRGTSSGAESSTPIATGVTATSYTNTGLTNGTTYYYKVAAVNSSGTSAQSSEASATPKTVPSAPSSLSATPGNSQVSLSWASSSGATSYNVYRGTSSGGEGSTLIATGISSTSYTNTGLSNGTTYYFKVAAVNSAGTSALSGEVSATPQTSIPASPTGLTASAGNSQVSLSWSSSSGATSYNIYRGTSSGGENSTAIATGITTTSYTNTGLTNGTTYYYKVAAVNAAGTSGQSNEASATPSSGGTSYYVSPSGSDGNAGTLASPWLTPQHAANVATAGSTVYLEAGTYAPFTVNVSGSASGGYITFTNYNGGDAIIDGTGFTGSYDQGLVHIVDESYIIIKGLEIRNGSSSSTSFSPCGVCVKTYASTVSNVEILNNNIHNIAATASSNGDAHGILVRGENASGAMTNITVSGNQIYNCTLGWSESLTMAGNLNTFTVSGNTVHDNNNIGIDAEGGYSSIAGGASASNGTIKGNTVYNCSTLNNPYYSTYSCAGLYDDGAVNIVFDGNVSHNNDYGCEVSSENSGHNSSSVTVRNNLIYDNSAYGIGIGGYQASGVGGTTNCTFVNNTLYNNDTLDWWVGEIHIGWAATGNVFDNNIIYAGSSNDVMVKDVGTDGASVGTFDYNDYYSTDGNANAKWQWINQTSWTYTLSSWQSMSGQDAHSVFGDPLFTSTSTPNFNIGSGSPALNSGNYGLGSSDYGTLDYAGNPRTKSSTIDMGAYED